MNQEPHDHLIDPELEARIVAMVLGEASDFERDELGRLIDERAELAAFYAEISHAHGLLEDVGTGELAYDDDWKLPADKRNAILAVVSGEAVPDTAKDAPTKTVGSRRITKNHPIWKLMSVAAACGGIGLIASVLFFQSQLTRMADTGAASAPRNARQTQWADSSDDKVAADADYINVEPSIAGEFESMRFQAGLDHTPNLALPADGYASPKKDAAALGVDRWESKQHWSLDESDKPARGSKGIQRPTSKDAAEFLLPALNSDTPVSSAKTESYSVQVPAAPVTKSRAELGNINNKYTVELPDQETTLSGGVDVYYEKLQSSDETSASNLYGTTVETAEEESLARPATGVIDGKGVVRSAPDDSLLFDFDGSERFGVRPPSQEQASQADGEVAGFAGADAQAGRQANGVYGFGNGRMGSAGGAQFGPRGGDRASFGRGFGPGGSAVGEGRITEGFAGTWDRYDNQVNERGQGIKEQEGIATGSRMLFRQRKGAETPMSGGMGGGGGYGGAGGASSSTGWYGGYGGGTAQAPATVATKSLDEIDGGESAYKSSPSNRPGIERLAELQSQIQPSDAGVRNAGPTSVNFFSTNRRYVRTGGEIDLLRRGRESKRGSAIGLDEKNAAKESFSTFSLHVGDVSFKLARAALAKGEWPDAAKIRVEEFVNAFDYGDPLPCRPEQVACALEQSIHPFLQSRNLLRVSMRTAAAGRASKTPLRLTFLLDNSGSMERHDRQQTVRKAFALLAQQLKPIDQVTLISFARQPRLLADKVSGAECKQLVSLIDNLPSEGGTNVEAALQLAFEKAKEQAVAGAQNRIVLLTDGAVNLGDANPDSLARMITTIRNAGIAFDAAGISAEGLNDEVLEALTRKGDGRYYLLDSAESADEAFAQQIAGALRPSAKNVKVQIEFNPERVGNYKLLGFEKHRLKKEDFRNDKVDAAEMAAAEAGIAVYQIETKPDGSGDVGTVSVRFRDLSTGQMVENLWPIPYDAAAPRPMQASPSMCLATSSALFAAKLQGGPLGESVDLKTLSALVSELPGHLQSVARVRQLKTMIQQARQLSGKE